jgi:hypothetical protein
LRFLAALNLKKLQANARRRLGFKGKIEFKTVPKNQIAALQIGPEFLSTATDPRTLNHTIMYVEVSSLDPLDVYHEFCKVKLYESGFTTIESAALNAIRDSSKEDPKFIRDANSAVAIVSEAYVNYLLFANFEDEVQESRSRIISRFETSDALTTLHTQLGFWGTAAICYYKLATDWAERPFPSNRIEAAMGRASDGEEIHREYDQINELLKQLPKLDLLKIERVPDAESILIVHVITELFSAKTALREC